MKRYGNLFAGAISKESLYAGYLDARASKRATDACFRFERSLGWHIQDLHDSLAAGTYEPRPYNTFQIFEPKPRIISAPAFRDRVVQHAVYRTIRPIFDRVFIGQSFACRIGKGTHAAADYVQAALQAVPRDSWVLQMDIRRYYYSLDRGILRALIERKIKDKDLVELICRFSLTDSPLGVPIGNLLSQLFGLIYLDSLDHFVKRDLNVRYYARYVDDFVMVGVTRPQAESIHQKIETFLADKLRLGLSHSAIFRVQRGINFVGYRTWASSRFVRKRALFTFRRSAKRGNLESVISSLGHARRTASFRHMTHYLQEHHHGLYRQLPKSLRPAHHVPTPDP